MGLFLLFNINLRFYDLILFGFVSRNAWRCPTGFLDRHYANHISNNHLEVGPGTGFLLNRVSFTKQSPRMVLMDLSLGCLEKSANRLKRYQPEQFRQNILEPIEHPLEQFDSIAINYVLHCVPGSFKQKGVAFAHLKKQLKDGGILFGSTILYKGVKKNIVAKAALWTLHQLGIFTNQQDCLEDLRESLEANFSQVDIEVRGPTAVFSARD
jgi:2-polyprenyl-3-methyl-5-hydroxy-6-metoxy-1,4-benzoquinol methylase